MDVDGRDGRGRTGWTWTDGTDGRNGMDVDGRDGRGRTGRTWTITARKNDNPDFHNLTSNPWYKFDFVMTCFYFRNFQFLLWDKLEILWKKTSSQ